MTVPADPAACSEALDVLAQIERGEITITAVGPHWCFGDSEFTASNGWHFWISCDGCWSYVDKAVRPDGTTVDAFAMPWEMPDGDGPEVEAAIYSPINGLRCYHPPADIARSVWQFPCE